MTGFGLWLYAWSQALPAHARVVHAKLPLMSTPCSQPACTASDGAVPGEAAASQVLFCSPAPPMAASAPDFAPAALGKQFQLGGSYPRAPHTEAEAVQLKLPAHQPPGSSALQHGRGRSCHRRQGEQIRTQPVTVTLGTAPSEAALRRGSGAAWRSRGRSCHGSWGRRMAPGQARLRLPAGMQCKLPQREIHRL